MAGYWGDDMNLTGREVVAKSKGNDKKYLAWLRTLPCCVCGAYPPSEACHVRLGGRSIMGGKPKFSAVPMCRDHHHKQHQYGHSSIMPTEMWLELADKYLEKFLHKMQNSC